MTGVSHRGRFNVQRGLRPANSDEYTTAVTYKLWHSLSPCSPLLVLVSTCTESALCLAGESTPACGMERPKLINQLGAEFFRP